MFDLPLVIREPIQQRRHRVFRQMIQDSFMDWRRFLQAGQPATTNTSSALGDGGRIFDVGSKIMTIDFSLDGRSKTDFRMAGIPKSE